MYIRDVHTEGSLIALRRLVRANPLGLFTTAIDTASHPFLQSSHIPFVLDVEDESSEIELGRLRGHLARANPQSKAIMEEVAATGKKTLERDILVIFTSPAQHYVTPKFYTETKPTSGKVVPTWNYGAVQVYGRATVFVDTKAEETGSFLDKQISDLTKHNEETVMGFDGKGDNPGPWKVTDAPERYIGLLKKAIIGVDIEITRMEGKYKMSQELPAGDADGVIKGFKNLKSDAAQGVASLVEERKEPKARK
jgi:transcriptional regulator